MAQLLARSVEVQPGDMGQAARAVLAVFRWHRPLHGAGQSEGRRHKPDLYEPELNAICTNPLSQLIIYTFCLGDFEVANGGR